MVSRGRRMMRAELMGSHTHVSLSGTKVHVWLRSGRWIARGRHLGRPFGENLGATEPQALACLRDILSKLDHGVYVRPTERRNKVISRSPAGRHTLRELVSEFLAEKRQTRGQQTALDYRVRLNPVLDFAEQSENLKRWPLARDIDVEFALKLRAYLYEYRSTRNGRANGVPKTLSGRQVFNILECLRTMLHWARSASNRILPADWLMPVTAAIIGVPPKLNPLRPDKLPLDLRAGLVHEMDVWQLCHLILSFVLPLRPDEAAGLLVSDINWQHGWLEFGERMKDANFTKGKTAFVLPYPGELLPILRACVGGRADGPLLRSRGAFEEQMNLKTVESFDDLVQLFDQELRVQPDQTVQAEHDRKRVFRRLLRRLGGVSEDAMNREFKSLLASTTATNSATLYTLRGSVTTAMHRAHIPHLELRYLTGHSTNDILNAYTTLDPVGAMYRYFESIRPLLNAIAERATALGKV